jgi:hypothetical protein
MCKLITYVYDCCSSIVLAIEMLQFCISDSCHIPTFNNISFDYTVKHTCIVLETAANPMSSSTSLLGATW